MNKDSKADHCSDADHGKQASQAPSRSRNKRVSHAPICCDMISASRDAR